MRAPLQSSRLRSAADAATLIRRLTERDRSIVDALARCRVLTSDQLGEMFFSSQSRARVRLAILERLRVLDRFQPDRPGGGVASYHYVLGPKGAAIVAAEAGDDPYRAARRWKGERTLALGRTQRLAHMVGVNGFYAALVGAARRGEGELTDWLSEAECARWTQNVVRPDSYGAWREGGASVEFFVEWDRGTETLARLADKLPGYERLESERGASAWVLFAFGSARREGTVRRALAGAAVPVATGVVASPARPQDALWRPLLGSVGRVGLAALGGVPKPHEAEARAAAGGLRAWMYERPSDCEENDGPVEKAAVATVERPGGRGRGG